MVVIDVSVIAMIGVEKLAVTVIGSKIHKGRFCKCAGVVFRSNAPCCGVTELYTLSGNPVKQVKMEISKEI